MAKAPIKKDPATEAVEEIVETIEDAVDDINSQTPPAKPMVAPKKKETQFVNTIDLSPIMGKIDEGFKNLEKALTKTEPATPPKKDDTPPKDEKKSREYRIGDEFDPSIQW